MTETLKPIFKLCSLTPVGFRIPNYPAEICLICRAPLLGVCIDCQETKSEICPVKKSDSNFYHEHCMTLIETCNVHGKKI
jgi:hypothetical protein